MFSQGTDQYFKQREVVFQHKDLANITTLSRCSMQCKDLYILLSSVFYQGLDVAVNTAYFCIV